jgi:hypothetical protein
MNALQLLWQPPVDIEAWLILAYVTSIAVGARVTETLAKRHFRRAQRYAEHGFDYIEPRDEYQCLGGASLKLDSVREAEKMAIYRAPVEHCGGCRLKPACAPLEESRQIYRSLAIWAETDVGRFHKWLSVLMFVAACLLSFVGLWRWCGQPGAGYLALAGAGSTLCLLLQSRRMGDPRPLPVSQGLARPDKHKTATPR